MKEPSVIVTFQAPKRLLAAMDAYAEAQLARPTRSALIKEAIVKLISDGTSAVDKK